MIPPEIQPYLALVLLALTFGAFMLERVPPAVVAIGGASVFVLLGFVSADQLLSVFSNSAPLTIAAMFILSGALVRTGALDAAAKLAIERMGDRPALVSVVVLLAAMVSSAFVNNTPVVILFMPIVVQLAGAIGRAPSKLLIPLSYAAILGGTCTLIGTSTNLLVDGVAQGQGLAPFGIFEITPVGIVTAVVGGLTLVVLGAFALPDRGASLNALAGDRPEYLTELSVPEASTLIGRKLGEVALLGSKSIRIRAVLRRRETIRSDLASLEIAAGDRLVAMAPAEEILTLHESSDINVGVTRRPRIRAGEDRVIMEAVVAPSSGAIYHTLQELGLGARYDVLPLALHRHQHIAGPDLGSARLRAADTLLIEGASVGLAALAQDGDFVSINQARSRPFRRGKAPWVIAAFAAVVVLAALKVMPIAVLAMLAAAFVLATRCVDLDEALQSIDGNVLLLIFAMLAFGIGIENSGAAMLIVDSVKPYLADASPLLLLLGIYALTSVLTEIVTNSAVAVIVTPLAVSLSQQLGHDPRPFVVAVMFGASASFATPIGYQTNTLVYGAGNYRFSDFLKIGVPMNIIVGVATCLAIQMFMGV